MRIIPAYAGSTTLVVSRDHLMPDHPRIRGEHGRPGRLRLFRRGSSPHTRGARLVGACESGGVGIIPAYAGSTRGRLRPGCRLRHHPRIRGEHACWAAWATPSPGSSPHTRGAHRLRARPARRTRIIPAYAGSTRTRIRRPCWWPDHPRIRGEHKRVQDFREYDLGSSPHTRGALEAPVGPQQANRIIPAYAGSTRR